ncbi:kynureninase [Marinihelvus fidelis]|uniref:Kynureninase n=1 Tax=Marinihelvus fidelis TaxID=2613842 RepID=A0A5N0T6R6_9GAMM|nr:kynureninase [Marinihelvus fidelis]KAA9130572.1 kynureninase [Marinihelvus fidelis]
MIESLEHARALDSDDPLARYRDAFWIPRAPDGGDAIYLCGHSLGLQPRALAATMDDELGKWRALGVDGHFAGEHPWVSIHETVRGPLARLSGARADEVVAMNSLTVNLHLLMLSFYRPNGDRCRIVIERQAFPSDRYAVESQIRLHGLDPAECLVELGPADGGDLLDESVVEDYLQREGQHVALVLWPGVHYATGQRFDLRRIVAAAHGAGARVGFDLAHAAGNVPLALHDDGADFAAWCTYKYLNSGPGAVAAAFVHARHHDNPELPRLHGWWGADPATRFRMGPDFNPAPGADAWQLSNPPVLALAPVRASMALFDETGMDRLRAKSRAMTAALDNLVRTRFEHLLDVVTPSDPERRGCQLSLRVRAGRAAGRALFTYLAERGVVIDWREPDLLRLAPVPLYNRFEDLWRLGEAIHDWSQQP